MILISLLLVLAIERVMVKSKYWRFNTYTSGYHNWLVKQKWLKDNSEGVTLLALCLLPALITLNVSNVLGDLLTFLLQTAILMVCVGCQALRNTYKCFLGAANRGDLEACSLYTDQLGHCNQLDGDDFSANGQGKSFGQHLLWLNYQHYAAVVLWFIALGATGAVAYVMLREWYGIYCKTGEERSKILSQALFIADFIPVRITAFGLLFVGHFSKALPTWMGYLADTKTPPEIVLTRVASMAEMVDDQTLVREQDASYEPRLLVKLAKRNIIFLLAVTSLLTVSGLIA